MGLCFSRSRDTNRQLGGVQNGRGELRHCSSLLEKDLGAEEKVLFMTRHHKKGLFDIPYRLRAGGDLPNMSQTTKDIIDASVEDTGMVKEKKKVQKPVLDEAWVKDVSQRYELISTLGMGGTSTVWLGKDCTSGDTVAIKVFKRPIERDAVPMLFNELLVGSQSWFDDTVWTDQVVRDSVFLCHTRSAFLTKHCYGVVMDVAKGGNLAEYVSATCGKHVTPLGEPSYLAVDEEQARFIYRQMLQGIRHMHKDMHAAHRDIKLDNTVIVEPWTEAKTVGTAEHCVGRVEFVDFQFAYHYEQNSPMFRCKDLLGTPVYMSPELLALRFDSSHHQYDPITSDIWASGILLVAMLFGTFPFDDRDPKTMDDLEKSIYEMQQKQSWKQAKGIAPYLKYVSQECIDLLDSVLQVDPSKRSSLSQIEMNPWIRKQFESKSLEDGWKAIQKDIQEHREKMMSLSLSMEKSTRENVAAVVRARNKAVKRMIEIATQPYDEEKSVLNEDVDSLQDSSSQEEWHLFCAPEIAGLVDHHSFSDDLSLEISMNMCDVYTAVNRAQ